MTPSFTAFSDELSKIASADRETKRLIGEAIGEASMCWSPRPSDQVFDSERASAIVDRLARDLAKTAGSMRTFCKSCQKEHAPICDRCGKKDGDFRSLHGPCGRCAFPNGVGGKKKEAGFLHDVGSNVGNTLKGFAHPVDSLKRGWNFGGWTQQGDAMGMVREGRGAQMSPRFGQQWAQGKGVGRFLPGSKTLTLGTGALMLPGALKKEDPTGQGMSRAERLSRLAGGTAGGLMGAPFGWGISGSLVGGLVGEQAGALVGKAINRVMPGGSPATPPGAQQRLIQSRLMAAPQAVAAQQVPTT